MSCDNVKFCEVCKAPLSINKKTVYVVSVENQILHYIDNWNAVDCPHCGCQNLLKKRYEKIDCKKKRTLQEILIFGNMKCNCKESEETDNE